MQRRRLARAGRPHAEDEAVGFLGDFFDLAEVTRGHVDLVEGDQLARREQAHDHVFVLVGGRDRGDAQLDLAVGHLELELAVLRLAALGDVELGHDLDPRDDGPPVGAGDLLMLGAAAVDAIPDHRVLLGAVGLDVDVGRARLVGVHDDLVGEADDRAVVLVKLAGADVQRVGDVLVPEIAENRADRVPAGAFAAHLVEEEQDVLPEPDRPLDLPVLQRLADAVHPLQILRVVDQHHDRAVLAPERQPEVAPQILEAQALHEIRRRQDPLVVFDERASVELTQRDAQLALRDLVLLDQDRLDVGLATARLGDRRAQLLRRDLMLRQEIVELRLGSALTLDQLLTLAQLRLVVERDTERLGDPGRAGLVLLREPGAPLLVQELDDADRPPLVYDRHAQNLLGSEPRLLVPRAVEAQGGRDPSQLGLVVGVGDVHHPARRGDVTGDALFADRQPDLLDSVEGEELRVELLLGLVNGVDRHAVGVEEAENLLLLERRHLGAGATGKSGSLVRMHYTNEAESRLAFESLKVFRDFQNIVGGDCGFEPIGFVQIVPPGYEAVLARNVARQQRLGIATQVVTRDRLGDLLPGSRVDDVGAAAWEPESGFADPNATTFAFAEAARRLGATIETGCEVTRIVTERGRVVGVETSRGPVDAPVVVLVPGAWAAPLLAPLGLDFGLAPHRIQISIFRWPAGGRSRFGS